MLLSDIFNQLTYGEFSALSIGNVGGGSIIESDRPQAIAHINMALTELHKRFPLRSKEVFLQLHEGIVDYQLHSRHSINNPDEDAIKYIIDNETAPFIDDILLIEEAYTACGEELGVNNDSMCNSIYTTSFRTVQIPCEVRSKTNVLSILYRADHQAIPLHMDPDMIEVELPSSHLEALLFYVASRMFAANPSLGQANEGMMFMQKFEMSCSKLHELAIINKDNPTNIRLEKSGWV